VRVRENKVLRREGVTGDWRKLLNEELYSFYVSSDAIRVNK
jgi:hypothetical protein